MKRITVLLFILTASAVLLAACNKTPAGTAPSRAGTDDRLRVVASFHAIAEFAGAVGGDRIALDTIVPDGAGAHGFEPKAQDMLKLAEADVFVLNGLGMEPWAENAAAASANPELIVVDTSEPVDRILLEGDGHADDVEHANSADADDHGHGAYDPHTWIGLTSAMTQVDAIRDAFAKADPEHRSEYERNAARFNDHLQALLDEYKPAFEAVPNKTLVTGHAAFAYLCRDFGLVQNSVQSVFADGEPSARQLAELVDYSRAHGVSTIFAEHLASPDVSRTLANEVGAAIETVYTFESAEDGKPYLERMRDNLTKMLAALQE